VPFTNGTHDEPPTGTYHVPNCCPSPDPIDTEQKLESPLSRSFW